MLDLVEVALQHEGLHDQCQRLDGGMTLPQRNKALQEFTKNPNCTILLATISCAGVG
jgi:SNF2 family DNA or RNA helicase